MNRLLHVSTLALMLAFLAQPVQAGPHEPHISIAKQLVVDLADVPLNRPVPDKKNFTIYKPIDEFFPTLLGLRSPGAQAIRTKYFILYFDEGSEGTARRIAEIADDTLESLKRYYPSFVKRYIPLPVIIDSGSDTFGNAYVDPDNYVMVFGASPIDFEIRGTSSWIQDTFVHELVHAITLKSNHKSWPFQLGILNTSQANHNPDYSFSIPLYYRSSPRGFSEGIAQWESKKHGGDAWDSHRDMILRMAVLEDKLLSLDEMGTVSGKDSYDGERVYNQGFALHNYIEQRFGEEKVRALWDEKPFFNFNGAIKKVTGISSKQLYRDWKADLETRYQAAADSIRKIGEREGELIVDIGSFDYHPNYSPDGKKVAFVTNNDHDYWITELKVKDLTTQKVTKVAERVDNRFSWSSDSDELIYIKSQGGRWDIFTYNLTTKKEKRITIRLGGKDPALSPDGKKIVFVSHDDGTMNLALVNTDGTDIQLLTKYNDGTQIYGPKWSPDGKQILFSIYENEDRDIALISSETTPKPKKNGKNGKNGRKKNGEAAEIDSTKIFPDSLAYANNAEFKLLMHSTADERDPVWLPDGSGVVFSSNQSGIFNIYTLHFETNRQTQVTNVIGGAFLPTVSPDGNDIIYAGYRAKNYNIYRIPRSREVAVAAPDTVSRDYSLLYQGDDLEKLYNVGRYTTTINSYGVVPIVLLGPTFIGNRFGLDQLSAGFQAAWGDLLGNDILVATSFIGKNLKRKQDLNSDFAFFYQNSLAPVRSEQRSYLPSIFFTGSRSTINSVVDLGTVFAQRDTQSGTLQTVIDDRVVLVPNATQHISISVTEEDGFKDVFTDFVVGSGLSLGRQGVSITYAYRSLRENLRARQTLHDSTRLFQTVNGQLEEITDQLPNTLESQVILDDFLYQDLKFYKSHEWAASWGYQSFKPRTDSFLNPTGGRAVSFRYRRINATVTDSLAFSADLNQDNIPDPTDFDVSPTLLREDNVKLGMNEFMGSWNEFISLPGRATLALQAFVAYKDMPIKEVQRGGGTFEGVFYYPLRYYLGGLGTLRGYPYFSIAGGKAFFGRAGLTFPLVKRGSRSLPPLTFDKVYATLFFETAAVSNAVSITDIGWNRNAFLSDFGIEVRFQMFSQYRLPMFGYFIAAFPTKRTIPVRNFPGETETVDRSRIYFGLAF
ncbi:MAG: hypothetical protein O7G87_01895 [bacterium]|nr:hypothetical protein [bacterium]